MLLMMMETIMSELTGIPGGLYQVEECMHEDGEQDFPQLGLFPQKPSINHPYTRPNHNDNHPTDLPAFQPRLDPFS